MLKRLLFDRRELAHHPRVVRHGQISFPEGGGPHAAPSAYLILALVGSDPDEIGPINVSYRGSRNGAWTGSTALPPQPGAGDQYPKGAASVCRGAAVHGPGSLVDRGSGLRDGTAR